MDPQELLNNLYLSLKQRGLVVSKEGNIIHLKNGFITLDGDDTVVIITQHLHISIKPEKIPKDDKVRRYLTRSIYKLMMYTGDAPRISGPR